MSSRLLNFGLSNVIFIPRDYVNTNHIFTMKVSQIDEVFNNDCHMICNGAFARASHATAFLRRANDGRDTRRQINRFHFFFSELVANPHKSVPEDVASTPFVRIL